MKNKSVELNKIVGQKIASLRKYNGLQQEDVAFAIGCSRVLMSNVESGKHGTSLDKMILLAKLFQVPFECLLPSAEEYDQELNDPHKTKTERLINKIAALQEELNATLGYKK